ncbi:thioredoxin family protein [Thiohalomonas denitrificans]|uniref:Peroxiredoxin n=1 Tax=Thiohalomonas denitrificans TaxID=415747 RepID=A0A1G5PIQ6_9GAMM|nr:thioredoxin family protein [Thiohalomonas denitrificans]SCZ49392.1 Peroxiredoxin [Thiohalomonas denitrificans]
MSLTPSTMLELGTSAPEFTLPDTASGTLVSLDDFHEHPALLVAFICNHCPYVKHIADAFSEFAREYRDKGLAVVAISSNDIGHREEDGPEHMAKEVEYRRYVFPYLFDESQEVAKAYKAACTPDFFLFDGERRLVYRGQFDDSRPGNDKPVTGKDMREAVDALLGGKPLPVEQVPSIGCNIKWKPGNEPAYS